MFILSITVTMQTVYLIFPIALSFLLTLVFLPIWIRRARTHGLTLVDEQKLDQRSVAGLGGLVIVLSAITGMLGYVGVEVFIRENSPPLLAAVAAILLALVIGLIDDLLGRKIGLRQRFKPIITFLIAIPIMVVNAGVSVMYVPFLGAVNFGRLYPVIIVPVAIIGASNGFNILAGMNGLEAGLGIIVLSTLALIAGMTGAIPAAIIAACMAAALVTFLVFNWYPAKVLPGNTLTYAVGATIAIVAITGNIEKFALLMFIPYFIEFFLKLRGGMAKESLARPLPDGSLINKYEKVYSLNHIAIGILRRVTGKAREWEVVLLLLGFEAVVAAGTLTLFLLPRLG